MLEESSRRIARAAQIGLVSTVIVVAVKLVAAGLSGSVSVLAEGLQSLIDVAMSFATVLSVKWATQPADDDHPWGHGKAEVVMSAFQMIVVILMALVIAGQAALRLKSPSSIEAEWGIGAMAFAMLVNIGLISFLKKEAHATGSAALEGEAIHLKGDLLASGGILVGLVAYLVSGWKPIDPIVAIVFTLVGAVYGVRQLFKLTHQLMDGALPAHEIEKVEVALHSHPEVRGFHQLLTRRVGALREVALHVLLDDQLSFVEAHDLAEDIEDHLSEVLGGARVTLHYEPFESEVKHRADAHGDEPVISDGS